MDGLLLEIELELRRRYEAESGASMFESRLWLARNKWQFMDRIAKHLADVALDGTGLDEVGRS